jgi:hypothetical protein
MVDKKQVAQMLINHCAASKLGAGAGIETIEALGIDRGTIKDAAPWLAQLAVELNEIVESLEIKEQEQKGP